MEKLRMTSPDLTDANIDKLADLFPSVVTEAVDTEGNIKKAIDFEALRQELADHIIDSSRERYHIDWPGKLAAEFASNAPIARTLRPLAAESVSFHTTKNLFVEGDNLEALKLLQESYLGKVRLIYIDPPYNTGSDLVYKDDFASSRDEYLKASHQLNEEGERLLTNTEANGRFHSDWLSMIYPRLRLAKRFLTQDGVILVSIDDSEQASLRRLMDEVFGEQNFIAQLVWEKGRKNDAKFFSSGHEYVLVYAKSKSYLREQQTAWREEKPGAREIWDEYLRLRQLHGANDSAVEKDLSAWFTSLPKSNPSKKWARYKRIDQHGPWRDRDISWPGGDGPRYEVLHPVTNLPCKIPDGGWRYANPSEMQRQIKLGLVEFRADHTEPPFRKAHLRPIAGEDADGVSGDDEEPDTSAELATQVRGTYFYKQSQVAVKHLRELMGAKVFNNPKDHAELSRLFEYVLGGRDGIVMDFFAGSGSTAEAVFDVCARTGLNCQVILVQLPESLEENLKSATGAAKTTIKNAIKYLQTAEKPLNIAELTKIRITKAGERALTERKSVDWNGDIGFRAFRVDSSNLADVATTPDAASQGSLLDLVETIKEGRTNEDVLFEVLLDWGLKLSLPIARETVEGHEVFSVDDNALVACLDGEVDMSLVRAVAQRHPLKAVFRDASFLSDTDRINADEIFREVSPNTEVRAI